MEEGSYLVFTGDQWLLFAIYFHSIRMYRMITGSWIGVDIFLSAYYILLLSTCVWALDEIYCGNSVKNVGYAAPFHAW